MRGSTAVAMGLIALMVGQCLAGLLLLPSPADPGVQGPARNGSGGHDPDDFPHGPWTLDGGSPLDGKGPVFTENRGQLSDPDVLFVASTPGAKIAFLAGAVLVDLPPPDATSPAPARDGCVLRLVFEGAHRVPPEGREPTPWRSNYFLGSDPGRWRSGVMNYGRLVYEDLWDGINLSFTGVGGGVKYELLLSPGASLDDVRFRFEGHRSLEVVDGQEVVVNTVTGASVRDAGLVAFYTDDPGRAVPADFALRDASTYGFQVDGRDPLRALVIDPVWSTFIGGSGADYGNNMAIGPGGNLLLAGFTRSADFPNTTGAYNTTKNVDYDLYAMELAANGSSLVFSTFIGGNRSDWGADIALDPSGNIYITGHTYSPDFPTTADAYDPTYNDDSSQDVFVLKLSANGSKLEYSTYIGTITSDLGEGIAVDDLGRAYVTGICSRSDFPSTSGAFDSTYNGFGDAFALRLSSNGSSLEYSTFIGGTKGEEGRAIVVDSGYHAYVTGYTESDDFPVTNGSYDGSMGGLRDAFVARISPDGSSLNYSSYLGGGGPEEGCGLTLDGQGRALVTGWTRSSDLPVTTGPHGASALKGSDDAFVARMASNGSTAMLFTAIGGNQIDQGSFIAEDVTGHLYVSGSTESRDLPTTPGAFDLVYSGNRDATLFKLSADGSRLLYSTYLGGGGKDESTGLALNASGDTYVSGHTSSRDFPTTKGSFDPTHNGDADLFVCMMELEPPELVRDSSPGSGTTGDPFTFNVTARDNRGVTGIDIEHWQGDSTAHTNGSASLSAGDRGNGTWLLNITVPGNSTEPLHYVVHVRDVGGNHVVTDVRNVTISDNDAPEVEDLSATTATTGDPFTFLAVARDNVATGGVHAILWYGTSTADATNLTLGYLDSQASGNGRYSNATRVPSSSLRTLHYYLAVEDGAGNWNTTGVHDVPVSDDDPPRVVDDRSDARGYTGDMLRFSVEVEDNIAVRTVCVLHGTGGPPTVNSTMVGTAVTGTGNGTYEWNVTLPSDSPAPLSYRFALEDTSGNWNVTVAVGVDVFDNDPPALLVDSTPTIATTGDPLRFAANATDNVGVDAIHLEYWYDDEVPHEQHSSTGGELVHTIVVRDVLDAIHYRLSVVDTSGNRVVGENMTIPVTDDDLPAIVDASPGFATTGDPLTFEVDVTDNIDVWRVWVEHWYGDRTPHVNASMTRMPGTRWVHTILVPSDPIAPLQYFFSASDSSTNIATTETRLMYVRDNDPPTFGADLTETLAEPGGVLEFVVEISDNTRVVDAWVEYWYGDGPRLRTDLGMTGNAWKGDILVEATLEDLHYTFGCTDGWDNANGTEVRTVTLRDTFGPFIEVDRTPGTATTGDGLEFNVTVGDRLGVRRVTVLYVFGVGAPTVSDMEVVRALSFGRLLCTLTIAVPSTSTASLTYRLEVEDLAGHMLTGDLHTVTVVDNDRPTITYEAKVTEAPKGLPLTLAIDARDNVGVTWAFIILRYGGGRAENLTMDPLNGHSIRLDVPRHPGGDLRFRFSATDAGGNWFSTEEHTITLVNRVPEVRAPAVWNVTEGEDAALDLGPSISDANDGPASLTVSCDDPTVTTDGLVLRARYDMAAPDRTLGLTVSDGEDKVAWEMTLHVVNVNDAPVILSLLPENGTRYGEGRRITFTVEATDEEGDELTVTWTSEGVELGTGTTLDHQGLRPGTRVVRVAVSDGQDTTEGDITLVIGRRDEVTGPGTAIVLLVAVVVAIALAALWWWRRG